VHRQSQTGSIAQGKASAPSFATQRAGNFRKLPVERDNGCNRQGLQGRSSGFDRHATVGQYSRNLRPVDGADRRAFDHRLTCSEPGSFQSSARIAEASNIASMAGSLTNGLCAPLSNQVIDGGAFAACVFAHEAARFGNASPCTGNAQGMVFHADGDLVPRLQAQGLAV